MRDPKHPRQFTEEPRRRIVEPRLAGKPRSETTAAARVPEEDGTLESGREDKRLRMEAGVLKRAALAFAQKRPRPPPAPGGIRH